MISEEIPKVNIIFIVKFIQKLFGLSLLKPSSYLLTASIIGSIGGFLFWITSTNNYTESEVGISFALISSVTLLSFFSKLGFDIGLIRFFPIVKNKKKLVLYSYVIPAIAALAISFLFIIIFSYIIQSISSFTLWQLISFISVTLLLTSGSIQYSFAIAARRTEFCALQAFLFQVFRIMMVIPLILLGAFGIFLSYGIGTGIGFVIVTSLLFKKQFSNQVKKTIDNQEPIGKKIFRYSFANYFQASLEITPILILPVLVLCLSGEEENAFFGVAWLIANLLLTFPASSLYALFSEGSHTPFKMGILTKQSMIIGLSILATISIAILISGKHILSLFGEEYSINSYPIIIIFIIGSLIYFMNALYIITARVNIWIRKMLTVTSVGTVSIIPLSFLLIPEYGGSGAASSWAICQILISITIIIIERRFFYDRVIQFFKK